MEPHFPSSPASHCPWPFPPSGTPYYFCVFCFVLKNCFYFKIDLTMYIRLALNMGSSCLSLLRDRSQSWLRVQAGWGSSFPEINWRAGVPWRTGIYLVKSQRVAVGSAMIYVSHASSYPFQCARTHAHTSFSSYTGVLSPVDFSISCFWWSLQDYFMYFLGLT